MMKEFAKIKKNKDGPNTLLRYWILKRLTLFKTRFICRATIKNIQRCGKIVVRVLYLR